jgi:peptide/nickel transport system substrate-binding protein
MKESNMNEIQARKDALMQALMEHGINRRDFMIRAGLVSAGGMVGLNLNTYRASAQSPEAGGAKGGDGTLVVSQSGDPLSFNPNYQADDNVFVPGLNIYDTLVALDSTYQTIPALAQTWEVAEDGLTLTFHLVEGATWHDGEPVTSADVKYTFDTIKGDAAAPANAFFTSVASIDTPDDSTVVLNMSAPAPSLIAFMGWYGTAILPAHVYEGTDWTTNPANQAPIGSGPFKFASYEAGSSIDLDANLDYWGEGPYVDELVFSIIPDSNTALQALLNGEVDVLTTNPPLSQIETLQNTEGIEVIVNPIPSFYYLTMNNDREYTSNVDVRRGISMAINRQQIVDLALGGYAEPATTFYPTSIEWAANTSPEAQVPQYDPEAAAAAFDAAGYPVVDGTRFKLVFPFFTDAPEYPDIATIVGQNLGDVNVEVELVALEINAWVERIDSGDFDLGLLGGLWGPDPENLKLRVGTDGGVNGFNYSNPDIDALLEQGSTTVDQDERAAIYFEVQEILAQDVPIAPLATVVLFYPHLDTISGLPWDDGIGKVGLNRFNITRIAGE